MKSRFAWLLPVLLLLGPAGAGADVTQVLSHPSTASEVEAFTGLPVTRCVPASETTILCEWDLGKAAAGWAPLADAIQTRERVRLLCEFSKTEAATEAGSCTAHPMRSDTSRWSIHIPPSSRRESPGERGRRATVARERNRALAVGELDSAQTLVELSRLVGAAPIECASVLPGSQVCVWQATSKEHGHSTLATTIDAPSRKKLLMSCTLPLSGSARSAGSCRVEIGALPRR